MWQLLRYSRRHSRHPTGIHLQEMVETVRLVHFSPPTAPKQPDRNRPISARRATGREGPLWVGTSPGGKQVVGKPPHHTNRSKPLCRGTSK